MTSSTWWSYVATVVVLVAVPGPSQLLIVSTTLVNGPGRAAATAAGDLSANLLQIVAAGAGLGALVATSETAFQVVKWCGVAYLAWLGINKLATARHTATKAAPLTYSRGLGTLWRDGFVTSAANPKAILFFTALFPQFMSPDQSLWMQVAVFGSTYLLLDGTCLLVYALASSQLTRRLTRSARVGLDRLSGGLLIAASLLLGTKRIIR